MSRLALDLDSQENQIISTELSADKVACNPKYDLVATGTGHHEKVEDAGKTYSGEKFVGGLISIRLLSDFSIISEFSGPAGIVDLRWSSDGNKLWAMCRDGTAVLAELPIAFRK